MLAGSMNDSKYIMRISILRQLWRKAFGVAALPGGILMSWQKGNIWLYS